MYCESENGCMSSCERTVKRMRVSNSATWPSCSTAGALGGAMGSQVRLVPFTTPTMR